MILFWLFSCPCLLHLSINLENKELFRSDSATKSSNDLRRKIPHQFLLKLVILLNSRLFLLGQLWNNSPCLESQNTQKYQLVLSISQELIHQVLPMIKKQPPAHNTSTFLFKASNDWAKRMGMKVNANEHKNKFSY